MMNILKSLKGSDGSVKYLLQLRDKNSIEVLYMNNKEDNLTYNHTVCVSSQVGCNLKCVFCATGKQGFIRNLEQQEIFEQVHICNKESRNTVGRPIEAVVFAGMGEPLLNYPNVREAIKQINCKLGINNFELATAGVVPNIYRMIKDFKNSGIHIRLNLSLHATTEEIRRKLIPFSVSYDIHSVISAAIDYSQAFNSTTRIRYMLLKGLNDTDEDIERLSVLLGNKSLKLIISQYNENNIPGLFPPGESELNRFYEKISKRVDCGIFHNFGKEILGGCGQLRQMEVIEKGKKGGCMKGE